MLTLTVNGKRVALDIEGDTPLLWVLRDHFGLTGTKYGCGIGECGACSVHVDGQVARSCGLRIGDLAGKSVTTIDGLGSPLGKAVQQAWIAEDVPQCGYCQSGQIMAAAALLAARAEPSDADIKDAMTNICRCGTYLRVRQAIRRAAATARRDHDAGR